MRLQLSALQLNSILGKPALNIETADRLLQNFKAEQNSLLVLPELAFTGYNFNSPGEIHPFLEPRDGVSVKWALRAARRHNTHIVIGFPELTNNKAYNTAAFVSPTRVLGYYRKTHLYSQDKVWRCNKGDGFQHVLGPFESFPLKLQIGICMDLNPWEFKAPFSALEFASALKDNQADVAAVPMAWLASEPVPDSKSIDSEFVNYLKLRQPHPIPTIFANRCGTERGTVYAGSSTIKTGMLKSIAFDQEGIISHYVDI